MIVTTRDSTYEVQPGRGRFRRLQRTRSDSAAEGRWRRFEKMSPVRTDEPVRFFALEATAGRAARIKVWSTSPVVAVYPDDPADA